MMSGTDKRQLMRAVNLLLPHLANGRSRGFYVVLRPPAYGYKYQGVYACPVCQDGRNPKTNSLI